MRRARSSVPLAAALVLGAAILSACGGTQKEPKKDPVTDAASKIRVAEAYLRVGRYQDALDTVNQAIALQPQNGGLRNFLGQSYFLAGRFDQAEAAFRKALELDPYLSDAHNNLGALYDRTGRKEQAEKEFQKALADPGYATPEKAHLNLGRLYASQGRQDDALRSMRRAVEINPRFSQGHFELASHLDQIGKLEEAVREYEVAAPDYRGTGDFQYRLGFAYFRLGDREKAKEHLARVLEVSPGSDNAAKAGELLKMIR
jgi:type IV pilus biogenesis/stability protein PilW